MNNNHLLRIIYKNSLNFIYLKKNNSEWIIMTFNRVKKYRILFLLSGILFTQTYGSELVFNELQSRLLSDLKEANIKDQKSKSNQAKDHVQKLVQNHTKNYNEELSKLYASELL